MNTTTRTARTRRLARFGIAAAAVVSTIVPMGGVAHAVAGDPSQWGHAAVVGDPSQWGQSQANDGTTVDLTRKVNEYEGQF